jgi:hypothetical protein
VFVLIATGYPLLDVFVSILYFVLFVFWIILVFHIMYDLVRAKDMKGWQKALWVLFILVLPLLGALVYLIARGDKMAEREAKDADDQRKAFEDYIRHVANSKEDSTPGSHGS